MPTARFAQLDPSRRATILAVAGAEFAAKGFSKASYNAIIRAAGLSKGVMYYYFEDKADLCRTVVVARLAPVIARAQALLEDELQPDFWSHLQGQVGPMLATFEQSVETAALARLIYAEGSSADVLGPLVDATEGWCARLLARGQQVGAVRSDVPLTLLASAVTGVLVHSDRWFACHADGLDRAELERLSAACLSMVQQLASPQASGV